MYLTLSGTRADGTPRDQVRNVLRRDHVEEFAARRQPELVDLQQQSACGAQPVVDAETSIEIGIVDQAFPAHGRAWLLEINPHDDFERALEPLALFEQTRGVVFGRDDVVDGAGPD